MGREPYPGLGGEAIEPGPGGKRHPPLHQLQGEDVAGVCVASDVSVVKRLRFSRWQIWAVRRYISVVHVHRVPAVSHWGQFMSETLQILEKLNSLYSGAFSQLVTYTVGVLAFVGILIPLGIASFQNRQMKRDQAALSREIASSLAEARVQLFKEIEDQMTIREAKVQQLVADVKAEINLQVSKIDRAAMARSLHLQASASLATSPGSSTHDCLCAISEYVACSDERNLISVLRLLDSSLPKTDAAAFKLFDSEDASKNALKAIETLNTNGRYSQELKALRTGLADAKERRKPSPVVPSGS